jgi:hypothetical protein
MESAGGTGRVEAWPALPLAAWRETRDTLHMWTQIVGKIRLGLAPPVNHWWHVTLHLTSRGLSTLPLVHGERTFQIDFDLRGHELVIDAGEGARRTLALEPRSVADFYRALMSALDELGLPVRIWPVPVEVADTTPFPEDEHHHAYDPVMAERFLDVLLLAERALEPFRSGFVGKCSPVHFFWGGFDLAVTRFSGRPAPAHPPVPFIPPRIVREAYSHEVASCGFWPGDDRFPAPAFYAYAYPEPAGYREARVAPAAARYEAALGEFILPWDSVRADPLRDQLVSAFTSSTYDATARLGGWDRPALERPLAAAE